MFCASRHHHEVAIALGQGIALQEALFWMNVNLELLAIDHSALRRMRKHQAGYLDRPAGIEDEMSLLAIEIDRVMKRLRYWEEVVDMVRSGRRP